MPKLYTVIVAVGALCATGYAADLMPWQQWVEKPIAAQSKSLESLFELQWNDSGGKEGHVSVADAPGPWGGKVLDFKIKIDHHNEGQYPQGWPSFELRPDPKLDFSGYQAIRYKIRCNTTVEGGLPIRFILWSDGQGRMNTLLPTFRAGQWMDVTHRLEDIPALDKVDRVHFYICESDYPHDAELHFEIGGFELVNLEREPTQLQAGEAAMALWVGERADESDHIVFLEDGSMELPLLMAVGTGAEMALRAEDEVQIRLYEVFSGTRTAHTMPLGEAPPAGAITRGTRVVDLSGLQPGYYLMVTDILREGKSLLGGRVGCDDFYVKRPGESMTYTVLSLRTGFVMWMRDLLHGDIMGHTEGALPHTYDPLDEDTYPEFLRLFAHTTGKHTEGNEAGDTGLALAAEAFRKSGDEVRARFTEWLLEDSLNRMMEVMQAPGGGVITWVNELSDMGIGKGGRSEAYGSFDSNQMGEWMRALTYGIIYYQGVGNKPEYARKLSAACRKAADYLVKYSVQDSDGISSVVRHLRLQEAADGTVKQITYHQEGRQCDVYLGRALSGLSYYAYAMQLLGEQVPDSWWPALDNTVKWSEWKMKPNGWFDWQCEDAVEGGCHTFLGNMYIGEGLFGCYLASKYAGREEQARAAAAATSKAYHYVTDDCWIRGTKFGPPTEFWVGPYLYWLLTEYLATVGPDETFTQWLDALDTIWSEERQWRDFLQRTGEGLVFRASGNGMLDVAILGYLGIKQMEEIGQPLSWPTAPE